MCVAHSSATSEIKIQTIIVICAQTVAVTSTPYSSTPLPATLMCGLLTSTSEVVCFSTPERKLTKILHCACETQKRLGGNS